MPIRLQERIDLELKLTPSQMVLIDDVGADVAEDVVQEKPRDLVAGVCRHADDDGDKVEAVFKSVISDGVVWMTLEVCADALARAAEAEGYCWCGDRGADEVVGENYLAVF